MYAFTGAESKRARIIGSVQAAVSLQMAEQGAVEVRGRSKAQRIVIFPDILRAFVR